MLIFRSYVNVYQRVCHQPSFSMELTLWSTFTVCEVENHHLLVWTVSHYQRVKSYETAALSRPVTCLFGFKTERFCFEHPPFRVMMFPFRSSFIGGGGNFLNFLWISYGFSQKKMQKLIQGDFQSDFPSCFLWFFPIQSSIDFISEKNLQGSRSHSAASPTGGWKKNSWNQDGPFELWFYGGFWGWFNGIASGKLKNPMVILLMNQEKTRDVADFYPLVAGKWVIFCMAMENGPCIVDLPNLQMVFFCLYPLVNVYSLRTGTSHFFL